MNSYRTYWITLVAVLVVTFTILGFYGTEVYRQAPPIPDQFISPAGLSITKTEILNGQLAWQSAGGQQIGTVWGHGAYQAPDWTADWLHRELNEWLRSYSQEHYQKTFDSLDDGERAVALAALKKEYRSNTFNSANKQVTVSDRRWNAIQHTALHYKSLWGNDPATKGLRKAYAMQENVLPDSTRRQNLTSFFFWTAWSAATERPGKVVTYTNNWPHEPLIGNEPSRDNILWSIVSIVLLIAALGSFLWFWSFRKRHESDITPPFSDPLDSVSLTPSQRGLWKYVWVVVALFGLQCILGAVLAHYTVEGQDFYGFSLSQWLPYSLARTWHLQLALFWIATSFLTAGLFLAPVIHGGKDPKYQKLGVNILFGALILVVGGSLFGEALAIHQKLDLAWSFWFGIQGYEYVDLGRIWQIALFIGLILWLGLMLRGILPALRKPGSDKSLLALFTGAATAIGLFYGTGLFYGATTHLSVMEYWRWWVVHLWVEGFFEVFATVAISFLFVQLGLIAHKTATRASLASAAIFLVGGIPGTFHHLYFSGTPVSIMAIGACFSALEVVPLVLVGLEAHEHWSRQHQVPWMSQYAWPIRFFVGVSFWNLVGAGVFGFLINPPISLYYVQGLNLTPVHAHTATFGVYGLLSLGLILVVLRRLKPKATWNDKLIRNSFWLMNIGLALMVLLSMLPIGIMQAIASVDHGLWHARSAEFMQQPVIQTLRWMRMLGDTMFLAGVAFFALFVYKVSRQKI